MKINNCKLWCSPKRLPFALFDYTSLSYMVFALTSAVTTLPNIALIFKNFPGPNVFLNIFETLTNNKDGTKPAYPITVVYTISTLIGVAGLTSLPRVWTAFENVIHISLATRTKRFTLLLWEIDHLFPPISFVNGNNVLYFSSLVESVWGSKNLAGQKQTIHQLSERLNYHWVDWIKPLGRDSLGLLQRGVS